MCLNSKQLFKYCINARPSKAISGNNDKANDCLGRATERRGVNLEEQLLQNIDYGLVPLDIEHPH